MTHSSGALRDLTGTVMNDLEEEKVYYSSSSQKCPTCNDGHAAPLMLWSKDIYS